MSAGRFNLSALAVRERSVTLFYSWIFLVLHILTNSGSKCFTPVFHEIKVVEAS